MIETIPMAVKSLSGFLKNAVERELESVRIARAGYALLSAGTSPASILIGKAEQYLKKKRQRDGGWSDPEETAWALGYLQKASGKKQGSARKTIEWLKNSRHSKGGWGRHPRDQARIPVTSLVAMLVNSAAKEKDYKWLRKEWERDLAGPVSLSYKGAFYLLASSRLNKVKNDPLVAQTIDFLSNDQNDDGGFGPWKNHPIGSDPWSTGVVIWGLSAWIEKVNNDVIERALNWFSKTQLPSGYWSCHYLDEGSSYALIGAVSAMRAMALRK